MAFNYADSDLKTLHYYSRYTTQIFQPTTESHEVLKNKYILNRLSLYTHNGMMRQYMKHNTKKYHKHVIMIFKICHKRVVICPL